MIQEVHVAIRLILAPRLWRRLWQTFRAERASMFPLVEARLVGKSGLEVGGPSRIFGRRGLLPVYPIVLGLDNCNFASMTTWDSTAQGNPFVFERSRKPGRQFIQEATDLSIFKTASFDFVNSSHVLEHCANPLKALLEWRRVLRDGGSLLLVLPHKEGTFDHRRPTTGLKHLIEDLQRGTDEGDQTHLEEILALHDLGMDWAAGSKSAFRERSLLNNKNRCLHHHVFDTRSALSMVDCAGFQILAVNAILPMHICILAEKSSIGMRQNNEHWFEPDASHFRESPFSADRSSV